MRPDTRYAKSGTAHIAYQVFGEGEADLVVVHGLVSHIDLYWDWPIYARFMERLGSFARVVVFDKRGVGLSDRVSDLPDLEERMDDVRAVMDAAGVERAALFGISEGAPMALLFAATYPDRVQALVLHGGMPRTTEDDDYPYAPAREAAVAAMDELIAPFWSEATLVEVFAPSLADDPEEVRAWNRRLQACASPAAINALWTMALQVDVRSVVPAIHSPTLVLHRRGDRAASVHGARWMAEQLPDAQYVELAGADHFPWIGDQETVLDEIEEFLTGMRGATAHEGVLLTVLFTDIVNSTQRAAALGDDEWRRLLDEHDALVREHLRRFHGREVSTAGDGFLAVFDGPARAVRCARTLTRAVHPLGLAIRAGVHTGEVELRGDDVAGLAVHIGARIAALAGADEVFVSRTVKDLVVGSGLEFVEAGVHELKGVPDRWQLYAAVG
jgi:pimeloyl-ACP methyl ester carboxylesterase